MEHTHTYVHTEIQLCAEIDWSLNELQIWIEFHFWRKCGQNDEIMSCNYICFKVLSFMQPHSLINCFNGIITVWWNLYKISILMVKCKHNYDAFKLSALQGICNIAKIISYFDFFPWGVINVRNGSVICKKNCYILAES